MSRARPRRPRPVGRPITKTIRDELMLPAYSALEMFQRSDNAEALESARHTLAALLDYMLLALQSAGLEVDPVEEGLAALLGVIARFKRQGVYRTSGPELEALRAAVRHCDASLGKLYTHHIIDAVARVNRQIEAMEVDA